MRAFLLPAVLLVLPACGGGGPSDSDCERIADHVLAIQRKDLPRQMHNLPPERRALLEAQMQKVASSDNPVVRQAAIDDCKKSKLDSEGVACTLAATTIEEIGRCK